MHIFILINQFFNTIYLFKLNKYPDVRTRLCYMTIFLLSDGEVAPAESHNRNHHIVWNFGLNILLFTF